MDVDPLSVIFVKGDSKGDRLLFRYPYTVNKRHDNAQKSRRKNPYALLTHDESLQGSPPTSFSSDNGELTGFSDEVLSNLFAVKQELAESKFELKANNVRFVGHPTLLQPLSRDGKKHSIILINIVFALKSSASHSIVKCYYELSKRIGVALRHEENRCGYVTQEMKTMITVHDDFATRDEINTSQSHTPFEEILKLCSLARDLRKSYDDLKSTGRVRVRINRWIDLTFCLPQKVHQLINKSLVIEPETIDKILQSIRPYHALLLLVEPSELIDSFVPDTSPALSRLVKIYTPLKSLQVLSADADLTLAQVFNLAGHLIYWGRATIIYPLCESNIYMTAPNAAVHVTSPLVEKFSEKFPNHSLTQVMSEFSLPVSIRQKMSPFASEDKTEVHIVIWLLQHRLLIQLHTYVYFMPTQNGLCLSEEGCSSTPDGDDNSVSDDVSSSVSGGCDMPPIQTEPWLEDRTSIREDCLAELSYEQRFPLLDPPAGVTSDDLTLLVRLIRQDYLQGEHHLEEIMYMENIRRSQILQLIDKFRDVLITCEAEDPAIAMFYPHSY